MAVESDMSIDFLSTLSMTLALQIQPVYSAPTCCFRRLAQPIVPSTTTLSMDIPQLPVPTNKQTPDAPPSTNLLFASGLRTSMHNILAPAAETVISTTRKNVLHVNTACRGWIDREHLPRSGLHQSTLSTGAVKSIQHVLYAASLIIRDAATTRKAELHERCVIHHLSSSISQTSHIADVRNVTSKASTPTSPHQPCRRRDCVLGRFTTIFFRFLGRVRIKTNAFKVDTAGQSNEIVQSRSRHTEVEYIGHINQVIKQS